MFVKALNAAKAGLFGNNFHNADTSKISVLNIATRLANNQRPGNSVPRQRQEAGGREAQRILRPARIVKGACRCRGVRPAEDQNVTTLRIDFPACIRSKPSLIFSIGMTWVMRSSMLILPSIYQSTIFGTSV